MANIFDQYLKGKSASFQQGMNMLAMDKYLKKTQREEEFRNVLSSAYTQPSPGYEMAGPARPGGVMPTVPPQAGGMDRKQAINALYAGGFPGKAMAIEQQISAANAPMALEQFKDKLSREREVERMEQFRNLMGGSRLQPGQTAKMTPRGPELAFDPVAAQSADIAAREYYDKTGVWPGGAGQPTGAPQPAMSGAQQQASRLAPSQRRQLQTKEAEARIGGKQKRIDTLGAATASRRGSIDKAVKFRDLIKTGKMATGATRTAAGYMPGVFTKQAQLDEEFNAFAEVAARQALKASGEIRPTDADVEGMKRAMFGIGRDEAANITLLDDYIAQQSADEEEYLSLGGTPRTKQTAGTGQIDRGSLPSAAVDYLMKNNNPVVRKQFKAKYGRLPEGM